jgi:hypothetical protein
MIQFIEKYNQNMCVRVFILNCCFTSRHRMFFTGNDEISEIMVLYVKDDITLKRVYLFPTCIVN